ncbi:MAG: hypothetical protein ACK40X_06585 [Armatimonadota bacterium]
MGEGKIWTVVISAVLIVIAGLLIFSHVRRLGEGIVKKASVEAVQREIERIQKTRTSLFRLN